MAGELAADRFLLLRYEDVVADPDAARQALARFLGRPAGDRAGDRPRRHRPGMGALEARRPGPVAPERLDAWRDTLGPRRAHEVAAVCRAGMLHFGYGHEVPSAADAAVTLARLGPRQILRSWRYRRAYGGYIDAIDRRTL